MRQELDFRSGSSETLGTVRKVLHRLPNFYLAVIAVGSSAALLAHFLAPNFSIKGQSWLVLVPIIVFGIGLILWFAYQGQGLWPGMFLVFLTSLMVYWLVAVGTDRLQGDGFNYSALLTPAVLLMMWVKPLNLRIMLRTLEIFAWSVIITAVLSQFFLAIDWAAPPSSNLALFRFPLGTMFGFDYRWQGAFGDINYVGPLAAFLLVFGATRRGFTRLTLVLFGVVLLVVSEARGGFMAALAGLFVLMIFRPTVGPLRLNRSRRILLFTLALGGAILALVSVDPTASGRLGVWRSMLGVVPKEPILGLSDVYLEGLRASGELPLFATHGHNWWVESVIDQGLVGLFVVGLVGVFAALLTWRARNTAGAGPIAILAAFFAASVNEDLISGHYLEVQLMPLLLAVTWAASSLATETSLIQRKVL